MRNKCNSQRKSVTIQLNSMRVRRNYIRKFVLTEAGDHPKKGRRYESEKETPGFQSQSGCYLKSKMGVSVVDRKKHYCRKIREKEQRYVCHSETMTISHLGKDHYHLNSVFTLCHFFINISDLMPCFCLVTRIICLLTNLPWVA